MSALVFFFLISSQNAGSGEIKTNQNETFLVNHGLMNRFWWKERVREALQKGGGLQTQDEEHGLAKEDEGI